MYSINTKIIQGFLLDKRVVETEVIDGKEVPKVLLAFMATTDMVYSYEEDRTIDVDNRHYVRFEGSLARNVYQLDDGAGLGVQGMVMSKRVNDDNGKFLYYVMELRAEKIWLPRTSIPVTKAV